MGNRWGCFWTLLPVYRPYSAESRAAPRLSGLLSCEFSQHVSETRKDWACQNQRSVFNSSMKALKTVKITQNQSEKRRTSLGQVWGEQTYLTHFPIPGGPRNPACFHIRGATSRAMVSWPRGRVTPGAGSGEVRSPWDCGHVTQVEGSR